MITVLNVILDSQMSGTPARIIRVSPCIDSQRVRVLTAMPTGGNEFPRCLRQLGLGVFEIDMGRLRYTLNPATHARWAMSLPASVRRLVKVIEDQRVDVVHCYGLPQVLGPLAALLASRKLVWHINDTGTPRPFDRLFLSLVKRYSDAIVVSSDAVGKHYFPNGLAGRKLYTLYSAVDPTVYSPIPGPSPLRKQWGAFDDTLVIGIVANFHPLKGHRYFIEAARTIRDQSKRKVRFVIAGRKLENRSSYWNQMMELIKTLGLETDMTVFGHCGDVPELLRALDIFVLPSISEPLGVVVLEAMASGKPIVATNAGGVPEMVTDGETGILVAPESAESVAAAVLRLGEDMSLAASLARRARAYVEAAFTPRQAAARYEALYEETMQ